MHGIRRFLAAMAAAGSLAFAAPAHSDFINVGINTFNTTSNPATFSFLFTAPTTLSGLVSFTGTLFVNLSDVNGGGVSVLPVGGFLMQGLLDAAPVGNDTLGALTADFAPAMVFSGYFDCGAGCSTLSLLINFTLSPGDIAAFAGDFTVVRATVPEPGTLLLLAIGLGGFLLARKRAMGRTTVAQSNRR